MNAAFLAGSIAESPVVSPQQDPKLQSLQLMRDLCENQLTSAAENDSTIDLELLRCAQARIETDLTGYLNIGDTDDDASKNTKVEARPDGIMSLPPYPAGLSSGHATPNAWHEQGVPLPTLQPAHLHPGE